jgi:ELWxxDGT repeat protein
MTAASSRCDITAFAVVVLATSSPGFASDLQVPPPRPLARISPDSLGSNMTIAGEYVYYTSLVASEIWRTDGTPAGTIKLASSAVNGIGRFYDLQPLGNSIVFSAYSDRHGTELWTAAPTFPGIRLLKDIYPGYDNHTGFPNSGEVHNIGSLDDSAIFVAGDEKGRWGLWKTDGTAAGTTRLVEDSPRVFDPFVRAGDRLFFSGELDTGMELWTTDGTSDGTYLVRDISPVSSFPREITALGNTVFFAVGDLSAHTELWRSDGTFAGTHRVKDINPGPLSSDPRKFATFGDKLVFSADDGQHGREIWVSDGTEGGTSLLKDLRPGADGGGPGGFTTVADTLYFFANSPGNRTALWKSDGTEDGTTLVHVFPYDVGVGSPVAVGDLLFFISGSWDGQRGGYKAQLWATDGMPDSFQLVYDSPILERYDFSIRDLAVNGNTLYFTAPMSEMSDDQRLFAITVPEPRAFGVLLLVGLLSKRRAALIGGSDRRC